MSRKRGSWIKPFVLSEEAPYNLIKEVLMLFELASVGPEDYKYENDASSYDELLA